MEWSPKPVTPHFIFFRDDLHSDCYLITKPYVIDSQAGKGPFNPQQRHELKWTWLVESKNKRLQTVTEIMMEGELIGSCYDDQKTIILKRLEPDNVYSFRKKWLKPLSISFDGFLLFSDPYHSNHLKGFWTVGRTKITLKMAKNSLVPASQMWIISGFRKILCGFRLFVGWNKTFDNITVGYAKLR